MKTTDESRESIRALAKAFLSHPEIGGSSQVKLDLLDDIDELLANNHRIATILGRDPAESPYILASRIEVVVDALKRIYAIQNQPNGTDYQEIENARAIAGTALFLVCH